MNCVKLFRGLSVTTTSTLKMTNPQPHPQPHPQPQPIIKNFDIPSCKNCVFYRPYYLYGDFASQFNKCEKFGEKNIVTDEIDYEFANSCRKNENQCGGEGKFFIEEPNIWTKIVMHKILSPYSIPIVFPIVIIIIHCIIINL